MAVPKKRVSRTRKYLRNTHWKKDILQEVVRSFSAAVSLGRNPTRFNRGRVSKQRNRRGGYGQPFGYVFEILSEEDEAASIMQKIEKKLDNMKKKKKPKPPARTDTSVKSETETETVQTEDPGDANGTKEGPSGT
jgi:hypothetical protein